jgi:hypothetical protein
MRGSADSSLRCGMNGSGVSKAKDYSERVAQLPFVMIRSIISIFQFKRSSKYKHSRYNKMGLTCEIAQSEDYTFVRE